MIKNQMDNIVDQVSKEVLEQSKEIIIRGLSGITHSHAAFDLNKVDYMIDTNALPYRLQQITTSVVSLVIAAAVPRLRAEIEQQVREKIRNTI